MARELETHQLSTSKPTQQSMGGQSAALAPRPLPANAAKPHSNVHGSTLPQAELRDPNPLVNNGGPSNGLQLPPKSERDLLRNKMKQEQPRQLTLQNGPSAATSIKDGSCHTYISTAVTTTTNLHFTEAQDCAQASDIFDCFIEATQVFNILPSEDSLLAGIGCHF